MKVFVTFGRRKNVFDSLMLDSYDFKNVSAFSGAHQRTNIYCREGKERKYVLEEEEITREYQTDTFCIFCLFTTICIGSYYRVSQKKGSFKIHLKLDQNLH